MYERFVELLERDGVKPADVSRATGIRKNTLTDWKTGRSKPKADKLMTLAEYFGVSVEYFLR